MKDSILSLLRHGLTAGGGGLVANGTATNDEWQQIVGALVTIIGVVWSIWQRHQSKLQAASAQPPAPSAPPANPISKITPLLLAICLLPSPVFLSGCANPEKASYQAIGAIGATATAAHVAWKFYAATGRADADEIKAETKLWNRYCAAYALACDAGKVASGSHDLSAVQAAMKAVQLCEADLIAAIKQFLPADLAEKLNGAQ